MAAARGRPLVSIASGVKSTSWLPVAASPADRCCSAQAAIVPSAMISAEALTSPLLLFRSFEKRW
jgi:hypothetical protein